MMGKTVERRQYHRFQVKKDVLAVMKPYPVQLGQIINISEGGLVFQFFGSDELSPHYSKIDFFVTQYEKEYSSLPIVYRWHETLPYSSEKTLPLRLVGLEFGDMTTGQSELVKEFIAMNTE